MKSILLTRLAVALFAGSVASFSWAEGTPPPRERERIEADRAAAEARYGERTRACGERFIVTSCVDDAKHERRETLSRLRLEQNQLDDVLRKARAAERTEAIRKRAAAETQRAREGASPEPREPARRPSAERHLGKPEGATANVLPSPARSPRAAGSAPREGVSRAEDESRSRATFDAAQRDAEAHRVEVEQRNAQHAAKHKPAAPLPLPPGASAP